MADSPGASSPIDSSFDASDVATPCTVIAAKIGLRNQKKLENEENEGEEEVSHDEDDVSAIYVDDYSKGFSEDASSVLEPPVRPPTFARTITKVYCHVDDQEHPYMVEVHVPPDCITLRDVKRKLMRTNFKYYAIVLDPDTGLEVKAEVRDDSRRLYPLKNGQFELFLLTVEGSVHSDNSSGKHRSSKKSSREHLNDYERAARQYDNGGSDSEASSLPTYVKKAHAYNRRVGAALQAPPSYAHHVLNQHHQKASRHHHRNLHHHRPQQNHYEDSTFDVTESDDYGGRDGETYYDEEEDDSRSINTDLTSVSQQHLKQRWRQQQKQMRNKWKSMSTTSSSFSSITESSMGLQVITVRLNVETMPLGMTPSGHRNARGDAGLYVGAITDRGAVALDGRIDVGDQILSINEIDLSNYSNDEAVQLLREAAQRQYVTLEVAKMGSNTPLVRNPRQEAVRPLDTNEWIKHATHAMKAMPSISEVPESSSTPIPDEWPSNSSLASGTPFGGPPGLHHLTSQTNKKYVVEVMAAPGSGLDIRDHVWMKLPIPMSVLGSDLVNWLLDHVKGLKDRKEAKKFASEMLKLGYIQHAVGKESFSENRYYVMGEECADYTQLRAPDGGFKYPQSQGSSAGSGTTSNNNNVIFPPSMFQPQHRGSAILSGIPQGFSMVSGYASMPASPFPGAHRAGAPGAPSGGCAGASNGRTHDDQKSQTSGSSRGSSRRYVELPRKTSSQGSGSESSSMMDRVASRSSFRAAMSGSLRQFNIDN